MAVAPEGLALWLPLYGRRRNRAKRPSPGFESPPKGKDSESPLAESRKGSSKPGAPQGDPASPRGLGPDRACPAYPRAVRAVALAEDHHSVALDEV